MRLAPGMVLAIELHRRLFASPRARKRAAEDRLASIRTQVDAALEQHKGRLLNRDDVQTFEKITSRLADMSITDLDVRLLSRRILGSATLETIDKNGRVTLPDFLLEEVGLGRELVLVGQGEYFEIWSPEEWTKQIAAQLDLEANNQRLKVLDLRLGSK